MADFLSRLVLFRHDPELVEEVKTAAEAEAGDVDAWYALGLIYAEGRGTAPDPVVAGYPLPGDTRGSGSYCPDRTVVKSVIAPNWR